MSKLEKFKKLINDDLDQKIKDIIFDRMFEGTRVTIYPDMYDFGYVYRQLAYYSSTWEGVYITGISYGKSITLFFEGESFERFKL